MRAGNRVFGVVRVTVCDSLFADPVCGVGHLDSHGDFFCSSEGAKEFRVVALGLWGRVVRSWHVGNGTCAESRRRERETTEAVKPATNWQGVVLGQLTGRAWARIWIDASPSRLGGVRIATWNVNSLKARPPRVEEWLAYADCDVLCMQETK